MKGYFNNAAQGKNRKNNEISVKLPQTRTEFGRKGVYFSAAKEYNSESLQARKTDSRLLFDSFLIVFLIALVCIYYVSTLSSLAL